MGEEKEARGTEHGAGREHGGGRLALTLQGRSSLRLPTS